MTKITWPAGTLLAPLPPALISCGTLENPNIMTAAWTGIISSEPPMTYVSVRPSRFSHHIILQNKEFVINVPTWKIAHAVDYCGVKSGKFENKFQTTGLTPAESSVVSAPQVKECPISLECAVKDVFHFKTHDMFLSEIVSVSVDDEYINTQDKLELEKAGLLVYAHGFYYTLGRQIGKFGFSVEKQKTIKKRKKYLALKK